MLCVILSLHRRAVYYCSDNCRGADFTSAGSDTTDPLRSHKFWCEKMAQYVSDSEIVAFPFPWADSEFYLVANCCFSLFRVCLASCMANATQTDVVCMRLLHNIFKRCYFSRVLPTFPYLNFWYHLQVSPK